MALKLSIFTTVTDPTRRGDNVRPALQCYEDLADEVVIVDGSIRGFKVTKHVGKKVNIFHEWPKEFDWQFFGEQFQRGYDACTGDWVIKADLDYIFHEEDFINIRHAIERENSFAAMSMYKYQFLIPDRYNLKSRLVNVVNKGKFGSRIKFNGGGDLCQVTLDGKLLAPDYIPESKIPFYNYEKILKTKEQITDDVGRMERAYSRHFGHTQYKSSESNYFEKWYEAQKGKFNKPQLPLEFDLHPKYIKDTIRNLKPENFGWNGFGLVERLNYVF